MLRELEVMVPEELLGEEDIKQQISASLVYRVRFSALPVLFGFAGWNKSCCKQINGIKLFHLLSIGCSLSV